ncbi:unnamed protein product [Discosporangium mesarthrocarpum]
MARSFLQISDELRASFSAAQDDDTVRFLRVEVVGDDLLSLAGTGPRGLLEDDFDSLAEAVEDATPCLFLLGLNSWEMDQVTGRSSSESATSAKQWVLVTWIPDEAKVRDKMIYSSSKMDLRQGLGLGFFEGEHYANVKADLSYKTFASSRRSTSKDQLLSKAELLKRDLNKQERASSVGLKSSAMGVIPFSVDEELREQLRVLRGAQEPRGGSLVNWVEMRMDGERIALVESKSVREDGSLQGFINEEEPRFILFRLRGARLLVYSCPERAPVRLKMTYSASKASVAAAAGEAGATIDQMIEIRAASEIDDAVYHAVAMGEDGGGRGDGNEGGASASPVMSISPPPVSKPTRPGRGRARLTKRIA